MAGPPRSCRGRAATDRRRRFRAGRASGRGGPHARTPAVAPCRPHHGPHECRRNRDPRGQPCSGAQELLEELLRALRDQASLRWAADALELAGVFVEGEQPLTAADAARFSSSASWLRGPARKDSTWVAARGPANSAAPGCCLRRRSPDPPRHRPNYAIDERCHRRSLERLRSIASTVSCNRETSNSAYPRPPRRPVSG